MREAHGSGGRQSVGRDLLASCDCPHRFTAARMHCKDVLAKLSHGQGCVHFARADARQLVCDVLEQCTYFRGLKATRRGARICARQTADSCRHRNAPVSRTASGRAMLMKAADVSLFRAVVVAVQRSAIFAKPSARVCRLARQLLCPTGAAQCGIAEDTQHVLEQIGQRGPVTRPVPSRAILKQIPAHETRSSGRTEAARVYFVRGRPTALAILTASERSVGKHPFDQPDEHGRPGIKRSHEVSHVFDGAKCVRVVHCQVDADAVVPDDLSASGEFVSTATYRQRWHPADYLSRRVARQSRAESAVGNGENALRRKRRVARPSLRVRRHSCARARCSRRVSRGPRHWPPPRIGAATFGRPHSLHLRCTVILEQRPTSRPSRRTAGLPTLVRAISAAVQRQRMASDGPRLSTSEMLAIAGLVGALIFALCARRVPQLASACVDSRSEVR